MYSSDETITISRKIGEIMSKTRPFGHDRCLNCGEYGAHFVPPSLGEEGFFHCKKNEEWLQELKMKREGERKMKDEATESKNG